VVAGRGEKDVLFTLRISDCISIFLKRDFRPRPSGTLPEARFTSSHATPALAVDVQQATAWIIAHYDVHIVYVKERPAIDDNNGN
jgi:hypothetical protein